MELNHFARVYFVLILAIFSFSGKAQAFLVSEEQQFQIDINEAKSRAKDFRFYLERMAKEERERQIGADQIKKVREAELRAEERARADYVRERSKMVSDDVQQLRLEKEWDREQAELEKKMEEARAKYVRNRERVRQVLEREAYIDEAAEYGL